MEIHVLFETTVVYTREKVHGAAGFIAHRVEVLYGGPDGFGVVLFELEGLHEDGAFEAVFDVYADVEGWVAGGALVAKVWRFDQCPGKRHGGMSGVVVLVSGGQL